MKTKILTSGLFLLLSAFVMSSCLPSDEESTQSALSSVNSSDSQ